MCILIDMNIIYVYLLYYAIYVKNNDNFDIMTQLKHEIKHKQAI